MKNDVKQANQQKLTAIQKDQKNMPNSDDKRCKMSSTVAADNFLWLLCDFLLLPE